MGMRDIAISILQKAKDVESKGKKPTINSSYQGIWKVKILPDGSVELLEKVMTLEEYKQVSGEE